MTAFARWASAQPERVAEIAAKLGRHRTTVYKYIRGEDMPRPDTVQRIVEITGGAVTAADLSADYQARKAALAP